MSSYFSYKTKKVKRNEGQVLMIAVISFTVLASIIVIGVTSPIIRQVQIVKNFQTSKGSYFTAEAGSEDAFYRIKNNLTTSFPETLSLNNAIATVTVSPIGISEQEILSEGNSGNLIRSVVKDITVTDGFEFNFAVQIGLGGLRIEDDSSIVGNVYSDGPILGDDVWHDWQLNNISGDAVSSGAGGSVTNIHVASSTYAHSISDSLINKNAYYQSIHDTTVGGTKYPGSVDLPTAPMPIPDSLLDQWEADALAGGVINSPCPYIIDDKVVTLGPVKINCDVHVRDHDTVITLAGTVFINGNLIIDDRPKFKVSDAVGNKSVPIIAHSATYPLTKGTIDINDTPTFYGSVSGGVPNPDSYVMLVSRNTSAESHGSVNAITASNHVTGNLLLYAPHGAVILSGDVVLREVTSYYLDLKNHAQVYYTIGLNQPLFTSGPGGRWKIKRWREYHHDHYH
ncbi:MAG: hypothetical protein NTX96_01980 [Candidatus Zambryskibacteria bacterium]|nr:hypothetical protein [Candidatus Zambryskibacteria bacterium]